MVLVLMVVMVEVLAAVLLVVVMVVMIIVVVVIFVVVIVLMVVGVYGDTGGGPDVNGKCGADDRFGYGGHGGGVDGDSSTETSRNKTNF